MQSPKYSKVTQISRGVIIAEALNAVTPAVITVIGGAIGLVAVATGGDAAAFGLAGTAIAGAAGLAQIHQPNPGKIVSQPSQLDRRSFSKNSQRYK